MRAFIFFLLSAAGASNAVASLIFVGPSEMTGTGLGAVETVLTIISPGSTSLETGCVGVAGGETTVLTNCGGQTFADSTVQTGASQIGTPTLAEAGLSLATAAAGLRIVLNAVEPAGDEVLLERLVLTFYGTDGATQSHALAAPVNFPQTFTGTGKSGFLFALASDGLCAVLPGGCPAGTSTAEVAAAQAFIAAHGGLDVRVGLAAEVRNATGGHETFFLSSRAVTGGPGFGDEPGGPPQAIPEPAATVLIGTGLVGLSLIRLRRRAGGRH